MTESFDPELLERAHDATLCNEEDLKRSALAGCYFCVETFPAEEIEIWAAGGTAVCSRCMIDSVLAEASGFPLTREFLAAMKARWFRPD